MGKSKRYGDPVTEELVTPDAQIAPPQETPVEDLSGQEQALPLLSLPRVTLPVFTASQRIKGDQMAGFAAHCRAHKIALLTIPEWAAEFVKFAMKPVG